MEKRVAKKVQSYFSDFKGKIRQKALELGISKQDKVNSLLEFICDYNQLSLDTLDFVKRKRVKNVVPYFDRCCAKRADAAQCTRRRKNATDVFCGTHLKGTPHGIIDQNDDTQEKTTQKVEVWAQDIQGIIYYIDKNMNVYQAEDIVNNKVNPSVIAKYEKNGDVFSIPQFSIF